MGGGGGFDLEYILYGMLALQGLVFLGAKFVSRRQSKWWGR